ncbi:MAG: hypothetical protein ACREM6_09830 [Vulcanimicrobiaceae bacterium]
MAAVLASFGVTFAICTRLGVDISPAILAAALAVGLMRRPERLEPRSLLIKFVTLPLIALAAGFVALALFAVPVLGAVVFSGGIALSIWLRNYGPRTWAIARSGRHAIVRSPRARHRYRRAVRHRRYVVRLSDSH